jgi:bacteriocin biosynthesis cyclodehydratase domain-containing protein
MRLSGPVARFVERRLAPLLDGSCDRAAIVASLPDVDSAELNAWLDRLVDAGALDERADAPTGPGFLAAMQLSEDAVEHLRTRRVAIVGVDETDVQLLAELGRIGMEEIDLVDVRADERPARATGDGARAAVRVATKDELGEALAGAEIVAHNGGSARLASAHWMNQIALAAPTRALFTRVEGQRAIVGPLVLPGEGPCFLCWRMRALATEDDYEMAMARESSAAAEDGPVLVEGPGMPMLSAVAASVAAAEIVKVLTAVAVPVTAGRIWELDGLTLQTRTRPVLQRPDCPACRKKAHPPPPQPPLEGLRGAAGSPADLHGLRPRLVDERTGIVRRLSPVPRDPTEPHRPFVIRAEIANHRFLPHDAEPFAVASGKGMTTVAAETSALGEALERYGAAPFAPEWFVRARAESLDLPAIEPPALVLYTDEQYEVLPYARWRGDAAIAWVRGRRLTDGAAVYVPALGTFMDYETESREEFLFQVSSNGLAAGPTLPAAVLSALYEVLERDAFLVGWLLRLPGTRVEPEAADDPDVAELARAYARRGVELRLVLLATEHPVAVAAAFGVDRTARPDRPAAVVGLGADLDWRRAVRGAALEVGQVRPALRARLRDPETRRRLDELLADPTRVSELEDHDLLYSDLSQLDHLAHWLDSPLGERGSPVEGDGDPVAALETLVAALARAGTDVVFVNLTPPELAELGLAVVRVHAPGLQPIHFGAHEARLGGSRVWRHGDGAVRPRSADDLNLHPHPLA